MPEVVAITGKLAFPHAFYEEKAAKLGHSFSKTITKKVTVLVTNNVKKTSTDLDRARKYGIRIVGEDFFSPKKKRSEPAVDDVDDVDCETDGADEPDGAGQASAANPNSPWIILKEGAAIDVSDSPRTFNQVRLRGGKYYCTCLAWCKANNDTVRDCKHLRRVLGPDFNQWRMKNAPGAVQNNKEEGEGEGEGEYGAWTVDGVENLLPSHEVVRYTLAQLNKTYVSKPEKKEKKVRKRKAEEGAKTKPVAKKTKKTKKTKTTKKKEEKKPKQKKMKMKKEPAPKLMLAHKWDEEFHDPTGYWVSEKYDGLRAFWDGAKFLSRAGNPFYAPKFFTKNLPKDVTLDGELYMGRKMFEQTSSIVRTQDSTDKRWSKLKFKVFDVPSRGGDEFEARQEWLNETFGEHEVIEVVQQKLAKSKEHVLELRDRIIEQDAEGLMLRKPNSVYVGKRTNDLLKVKKWIDEEARVVDHVPGKGKHTGRMGALGCTSRTGVSFRIGTGFNDKERENPPKVGSLVTFKYQELTAAGVPRFPVYMRPAEDHHYEQ
jgi:DNA ligase-1